MAADGPDKPWLDLYFRDALRGWIVGAYGLIFRTGDGGQTWQPAMDRFDNPKGLHLNAIGETGDTIYLAGEQGFVARSIDGGRHFERIETPYAGSYFGLHASPDGRVILAGLRGHAYVSEDRGQSWQALATPAPISFNTITELSDGRLLLVDQSGGLLQSRNGGRSFQPLPVPPGAPLTDVVLAADGSLVATSFRGLVRLEAGAAAPASTGQP